MDTQLVNRFTKAIGVVAASLFIANAPGPAFANTECNGMSCLPREGRIYEGGFDMGPSPDGFNYYINNSCPGGCNVRKENPGAGCTSALPPDLFQGCRATQVPQHYWYTHTSTCSENICQWQNSFWSESSSTYDVPTCLMEGCEEPTHEA